jgi:RNA polymerase sigma factor (sigma-70 family)
MRSRFAFASLTVQTETALTTLPDYWGELMSAAQAGDSGAYRRLLGEIAPWLQRYFLRRLPRADIDDAMQETLLAVHRRRHTYDARYPLRAWLTAIARHKWVDQLRLLERRAADDIPDTLSSADHAPAVISASVLARLMSLLKPAQAQAIELVKLRGYSIQEASRETGQSVSAVKVNIHRGIARLTALIEKHPDAE